jgi:hypothetical protein
VSRTLRRLLLAVAVAGLSSLAAGSDGDPRLQPLFHIAKNTDGNEIHYEARIGADCRFAEPPILVRWMTRREGLAYRRELNWLETHFAYGVSVSRFGDRKLSFTIAGDSTRPVEVALEPATSGCQAEARVRMLDQWVKPERAFIEILERDVLIPKIRHVDLRGRRPDGSVVCERLSDAGQPGRPCPSGE